jgi:hypothetical protein
LDIIGKNRSISSLARAVVILAAQMAVVILAAQMAAAAAEDLIERF